MGHASGRLLVRDQYRRWVTVGLEAQGTAAAGVSGGYEGWTATARDVERWSEPDSAGYAETGRSWTERIGDHDGYVVGRQHVAGPAAGLRPDLAGRGQDRAAADRRDRRAAIGPRLPGAGRGRPGDRGWLRRLVRRSVVGY